MEDGWLDELVAATVQREAEETLRLEAFLDEPRSAPAIVTWLGLEQGEDLPGLDEIVSRLNRDVAALDALIERQLNAILHAPAFQRLEASWRGLHWMVDAIPAEVPVKVMLLSVTWTELGRDADRAIEFDQSQLFKKVYNNAFGIAGGEPFGILLGDYYISHRIRSGQTVDDLRVLRSIQLVAAAAFAPFVTSAHPSLLGFDSFRGFELNVDLSRTFRGIEYTKWRALRDAEDSRFVALTLPRVLVREPYRHDPTRGDGFPFEERCSEHGDYLWGNACFALGSVVIRAFSKWGWLADIRGIKRGQEAAGVVEGLPAPDHGTDSPGVAVRFPTEAIVTDRDERILGDLGLIPLCGRPGEDQAIFFTTVSLHAPPRYSSAEATVNARLGSLLQYILCTSRIAHYVKVICRDLTGSMNSVRELEHRLSDWLLSITTATENASDEMQARFPLRESSVSVREIPGRPGCYTSVFNLRPHFQLDQMTSTMRLVAEVVTER